MEQIELTREVIEQWVKEHPIQWEETTADDQYGNRYNIVVESYSIDRPYPYYLIEEFLEEDGNIEYEAIITDNHRRHKRCEESHVGTRHSLDEAKRAVEEDRIITACESLRIKYER